MNFSMNLMIHIGNFCLNVSREIRNDNDDDNDDDDDDEFASLVGT